MKVFTCTEFTGFWPVGTAAVVVATNRKKAKELLEAAIKLDGLPETTIDSKDIVELNIDKPNAVILRDGDY